MMKEWSAARERVQEVKAKNTEEGEKMSKEITSVSICYTCIYLREFVITTLMVQVEQSVGCVSVSVFGQ